jgi:hypothetical protein
MFESRKPWAQAAALVVIFWKSNGTIHTRDIKPSFLQTKFENYRGK